MNLSTDQVKALKEKYGRDAYEILHNAGDVLEEKLEEAVHDIITSGVHVKGGMARLAEAFEAAGITADKPWLLETLTRTEVQKAYRSGAWQADRDPAMQEYLAGYEYVTAGDMRVRPSHALMDGARAPLDVGDQRPVGQADAKQQAAEIGGMAECVGAAGKFQQGGIKGASGARRHRHQPGNGDSDLKRPPSFEKIADQGTNFLIHSGSAKAA